MYSECIVKQYFIGPRPTVLFCITINRMRENTQYVSDLMFSSHIFKGLNHLPHHIATPLMPKMSPNVGVIWR